VALKILFADDSMTAQNMGKKILSDAGYEVVAVSNGAAALKKINELKPELVVLDVYMPGYTGLEVCEKMRAAHETSKTPVLLTVGKMEAYKPEDGARVKANGVIVKPFEATDLLAAIEKLAEGAKAVGSKAASAQKTVEMPAPGSEQQSAESWKGEAPEEIQGTKPESVSVPSEMASHAAYGFDELLPGSAPTHAPVADAAPALATIETVPGPSLEVAAPAEPSLAPQPSDNSAEAEFVISPVQVPSAAEFGVSSSFNSDAQEPAAGATKKSLLERFDAILKDGFSTSKAAGFEATAANPTPDVPVATEPDLETTVQKIETESFEIKLEPGLDPFSSEATATAQAEYQSWDVSEPTSETSSEPAPAAGAVLETVSLHRYVVPDVQSEAQPDVLPLGQLERRAAEPIVVSAETEVDDFEKRVAEAMAAYQSSEPGQEHEIAPAITEREAEDAQFAESKYAVAHETEHVEHAHEINASANNSYSGLATARNEVADPLVEAEPYVIEEAESSTPARAAAAAASATGDSELARALAEAVAAQNKAAAVPEASTSDVVAKAESTQKPMEATMITKIVTRVLEHSLPDILNKVMTELEKEEKEKKK
jgi:CheY-like chemotaxis protein